MSEIRVIVHAGAGKTGTTAIQRALTTNRKRLLELGYCYVGLVFDQIDGSQNLDIPVSEAFARELQKGPDEFRQFVLTQIKRAVNTKQSRPVHTIIWSNEALFTQPEVAGPALKALAEQYRLQFVAYLRRQDRWFLSAYKQWGVRHKGYAGRVQNFEEWYRNFKKNGDFAEILGRWEAHVDVKSMRVRVYDRVGDVQGDFLNLIGVSPDDLEIDRKTVYPSPSDTVLSLFKMYNSQSDRPMHAEELSRFLERTGLMDRKIHSVDASLNLPSGDRLQEILQEFNTSNRRLARYSSPDHDVYFPADEIAATKPHTVDNQQLIASLLIALVNQEKRLRACEEKLRRIERSGG